MRAPHDPVYEGFHPSGAHALEPLGLCEPLPRLELSPRKVRAYYYANQWWSLCSSLGICHLAAVPIDILSITQMVNLARAVRLYHQMEGWDPETGWPTFAKLAELGIEWAAKPGDSW